LNLFSLKKFNLKVFNIKIEYSDVCNDSDVFDSERSPNNCYDNKTYFQKIPNLTYSTLSDTNSKEKLSTSKKNQNIFNFPDSATSCFIEKKQLKNQSSTYELINQNQQTMNHFHTVSLPPPPTAPPPPPPPLSSVALALSFQADTEQSPHPLPPRPK
jgi:hypothetical protein